LLVDVRCAFAFIVVVLFVVTFDFPVCCWLRSVCYCLLLFVTLLHSTFTVVVYVVERVFVFVVLRCCLICCYRCVIVVGNCCVVDLLLNVPVDRCSVMRFTFTFGYTWLRCCVVVWLLFFVYAFCFLCCRFVRSVVRSVRLPTVTFFVTLTFPRCCC
jgi:hypothetical protein